MTEVLLRRGETQRDTLRGEGHEIPRKKAHDNEGRYGCKPRNAKDCQQQPEEVGRGKERVFPRTFGKSVALLVWTPGPQNYTRRYAEAFGPHTSRGPGRLYLKGDTSSQTGFGPHSGCEKLQVLSHFQLPFPQLKNKECG